MNSHTTKSFREALQELSAEARKQARQAYEQFRNDPFSPGLHCEEVHAQKHIWSARITRNIRALGIRDRDEITWYWIGTHREYEKRMK
jgi:hypothetical protein